ncbi:MAG: chemotaxis protein CheW [Limnochordaceae bacterium]|uniref:Chemotaxis protein CheW n=1 Tax=Carboxydichorda subterranea TaxID=3109565 RepID=A0ABZ1BYT6_9FIRM|nr:chemotaxis protein CheW [Limnochorda sp. L945t]MBE3598856.1 chemotaxis protein CheW [Limnochordaceae bacterium]WRP17886.1 chemotaxis protein CheW [Limnochorda sp. L945t]
MAGRTSTPAAGAKEKVQPDEERQLVVFQLGPESYGVEIGWVREIIMLQDVTRVPGAPDFVEGVINLRGHVIPVIDLRKRFALPASSDPRRTRIMVVDVSPHALGLVVDAVNEVLRVQERAIEPAGSVLAGIDSAFVSGVAKLEGRLVILLDLEKLLKASEVKALDQVQARIEDGDQEGDVATQASQEGPRPAAEVSHASRTDPEPA